MGPLLCMQWNALLSLGSKSTFFLGSCRQSWLPSLVYSQATAHLDDSFYHLTFKALFVVDFQPVCELLESRARRNVLFSSITLVPITGSGRADAQKMLTAKMAKLAKIALGLFSQAVNVYCLVT